MKPINLNSTKNAYIARSIFPFASITTFLLACALNPLLGLGSLTLAMLGGLSVFTSIDFIISRHRSKLNEYLESVFENKVQIISEIKTESGISYKIKMPPKTSSEDLQKQKLSIEQFINASIDIAYKDGYVILNTSHRKLKSHYDYELIQTTEPLNICIGHTKDDLLYLNIEDAPHILICGQTGSGKSVCLRSLLTSLIVLKDVELHLVDFQRVELGLFKKCAQFYSEPLELAKLLTKLKKESNRRLTLFEKKGVASIQQYKSKLKYKLIVIDEFATLAEKQYTHILNMLKVRIAQDRKCGIHYIICTQRPTTDVVDGTIKANIPVRIAFKTFDSINSKVILDQTGAEELRGKGHGLLLSDDLREFQGFYLSEQQTIEFITPYQKIQQGGHDENVFEQKRQPSTEIY